MMLFIVYALHNLYISLYRCKYVFMYNYDITGGMTVDMCPCVLLTASNMVYYWMNVYCGVVYI